MLRILWAFAWLRWRILLNSLERHGGRDRIERFSSALEGLAPILALFVMLPSALMLAAAGGYAGWRLAHGETRVVALDLLRIVLFAGCLFVLIAPMLFPIGDRTNVVRLQLLPIPRGTLYLAQVCAAFSDPWMMVIAAGALSVPLGLAAAGALLPALVLAAFASALLILLVGITLVVTSLVYAIARDRRRGELITVFFIAVVPTLGLIPLLSEDGSSRRGRRQRAEESRPPWRAERFASAVMPSEIFVTAAREAAAGAARPMVLVGLAGASVVLHGAAFALFSHGLTNPVTSTRRGGRRHRAGRIPGVSPATSAIALAQLKLGVRTPRGRSSILSPGLLFVVFAVLALRSQGEAHVGSIPLDAGIPLASFTSFVALLAIVPLAMNQFAVDGPGLTMTALTPVDTRALLTGKAIGNGLIAAIPATFCIAGSAIVLPSGHPLSWLCVPLVLAASYILAAPAAAAISAVFPRAVDMNSVRRSNAHSVAGLIGTLLFAATAAPGLLLALFAGKSLQRPLLALLLVLVWVGISVVLSAALFRAAARLFDQRREQLLMAASDL